jgi:ABC-type multidrug transport system fused ATPase/permease subunit
MTILVITHRIPTIRDADVIHVLERGRLLETGDWNALIGKEDGRFRAMYTAQTASTEQAAASSRRPDPPQL